MRLFAGNVQSYVKTLDLRMKWERKKQNPTLREPDSRGFGAVRQMKAQADSYSLSMIHSKLDTGKELSPGEMEYLREKHPELYAKARRIQAEREAYRRELRGCKTKEEVRRLNLGKTCSLVGDHRVGSQGADDIRARQMAISDEHVGFIKGIKYARLPRDQKELKKKKPRAAGVEPTPQKPPDQSVLYDAQARKRALSRGTKPTAAGKPARRGRRTEEQVDKA